MSRKIIHKNTLNVVNNNPKLPLSEELLHGEIEINFAKGFETISTLNSESGITTFSCDEIRDAKLSAHTENSALHLPQVTSIDDGKIIQVVNGKFALVTPITVYYGNETPNNSIGTNGDIYLQS